MNRTVVLGIKGFKKKMDVFWSLSLILCSSIIKNSQGSCADWKTSSGVKASDGFFQPDIDSEIRCKKTCLAFFKCEAIDWMAKERRCYLHDGGDTNSPSNRTGSVYFELTRVGECHVDCVDAFRAKEHSKLNKMGQLNPLDNTLSDCKKACIANVECSGFDWFSSNSEGERCYLQSDTKPKTIRNQQSAYYEIGRYWCKGNGTNAVTFSPGENTMTSTEGEKKRGMLAIIITGVAIIIMIPIIVLVICRCCVKKKPKEGKEEEKLLKDGKPRKGSKVNLQQNIITKIETQPIQKDAKSDMKGSKVNIVQKKPSLQQSIITKLEATPNKLDTKSEIKGSKVDLATAGKP